uniref:DDB1- and CUL4-associated factor 6 isoform X2 n=1 Tax=Myxine glutinosa TaxID=7769 RepID=UPI00358FB408
MDVWDKAKHSNRRSKQSLLEAVRRRSLGLAPPNRLRHAFLGQRDFVQRLTLERKIKVHNGCVNSICWDEPGDLLLSGSDDTTLVLSRPLCGKVVTRIRSGHRANIFSARFLPDSSNETPSSRRLVSCSGDGVIMVTQVDRPDLYGHQQFCCHQGTAYEVSVVPGEPHSFLSCGEDGTVRWFDLRTKSSCLRDNCLEDVLITCRRATTALAVSPLRPHLLGVACADSSVRLYDRRTLGTRATGGYIEGAGILSCFVPPHLVGSSARLTSLSFSYDGRRGLASYSPDSVFLFDPDNHFPSDNSTTLSSSSQARQAPMKRLRLRGDWSDTGPRARPESQREGEPGPNSNLMQRMSELLSRWFEEARGQSTRVPRESRRGDEGQNEEREDAEQDTQRQGAEAFPAPPMQEDSSVQRQLNVMSLQEKGEEKREEVSGLKMAERPAEDGIHEVEESEKERQDEEVKGAGKEDRKVMGTEDREEKCKNERKEEAKPEDGDRLKGVKEMNTEMVKNCKREKNEEEIKAEELDVEEKRAKGRVENVLCDSNAIGGVTEEQSKAEEGVLEMEKQEAEKTETAESKSTPEERNEESGSKCTEGRDMEGSAVGRMEIGPERRQEEMGRSEASDRSAEDPVFSLEVGTEGTATNTIQLGLWDGVRGRGMGTDSANRESNANESDSNNPHILRMRRRSAAAKIQDMIRRRKDRKELQELQGGSVKRPRVDMSYRGHRNSRTMIKEAVIWGEFVLSGSDCGHVFVWELDSGRLVKLLEADNHVINCLQPHPSQPVIVTSGIDYDVKLWSPTSPEPEFNSEHADEVVQRNELMGEESRNTVTVPASFMLRLLASFNHGRIEAGTSERGAESGPEQDDDEQ